MKRKDFDKKLKLSKETIVHLEKKEIENVYAGGPTLPNTSTGICTSIFPGQPC